MSAAHEPIGTSARRVGGVERVAGAYRFVADLELDGMQHVQLVHLDCARARIVSIDTAAAERVRGVNLVVTADNLPQPVPRFGPGYADRPLLAVGETKYHGEPVAAVVADTLDAAREAAPLVRVELEELPAVLTVADAIDRAAPLVREPDLRPADDPNRESNTLAGWTFGWGDVDHALADEIIERRYTAAATTHFAIEPHAFMAAPDRDGVAVWSTIQHPYVLQRIIATTLGLPLSAVRVHAPDPGGAFGGKQHAKHEPLLAHLALRTGRPVRLVLTLEETFQSVRGPTFEIRIRSGFGADGTIRFQDIDVDGLLGAYADIGHRVVSKSSYLACGPYRVPDARIRVRALLSHTPPATALRGFGSPQMAWAFESQMDEAAERLGIDRLAIRLRNLAGRGEEIVRGAGDTPADGAWEQAVRQAAGWVGWGKPLPDGHGRGIALGIKSSATTGASYAIVRLLHDGSVTVMAGTSDMGQGARTVLAQIAGQELGAPIERVSVVMGDTSSAPYDMQTSASRSTVFMGTAVQEACREINRKLRAMAAEAYAVPEGDVDAARGFVRLPDREVGVVELMEASFGPMLGEVIGVGERRGRHLPEHPLGGNAAFYEFSCTASEVGVDRETGHVELLRHVTVSDVGRALNPAHVAMQDEGAAMMGIGQTLMEHLVFDPASGRIVNLGALDYRIVTTKDVPIEMESLTVENGDGPGPYGAKGTGESGLLSTAPAIASAIRDATGVALRDLPLTPERVWSAIRELDGPPRRS
ncbi:MAG: xanthine dehydrogenase family protein molybdopterin-binding subunit [Candidatus Limnocylindria bacterium]